jgi:3-isopropylmalate dehydratase small subunit
MSTAPIVGHAHVLGPDISTDVHCSSKYLPGRDTAYIAQHAFEQVAPNFVGSFKFGDVIVAGRNFGMNSSREQAIHVMRLMGVSAIVAPSFGRQFFRNAINNGLPLVECEIAGIEDHDALEIDLDRGVLRNVDRAIERPVPRLPPAIQALLAAGGLIPFLQLHPDWNAA